jgi:NAD+ diphosphatase
LAASAPDRIFLIAMSTVPSRFFVCGRKLLFHEKNGVLHLYDGPGTGALYQRGLDNFSAGEVILLADDAPPANCLALSLRQAYAHLPEPVWIQAGRAFQILDWWREHRFCGHCGEKTEEQREEFAMLCPACGLRSYPCLAPAVIMAVTSGDEILLGRARHFPGGMYSTLAGFVEPGETLENAVRREVFEETGITAESIRYFGSQPWPFPHSLMIGFTAETLERTIHLNYQELEDARWFSAGALPPLPGKMSIARRLIDAFLVGAGRRH